jgi:hypothetical protein
MDSVLYIDIDRYLYKTALSIPKTSDLSWLPSCTKNPPCTLLLVAILDLSSNPSTECFFGTLSHSRRRLLVRPYPLVSTIYFSALKY